MALSAGPEPLTGPRPGSCGDTSTPSPPGLSDTTVSDAVDSNRGRAYADAGESVSPGSNGSSGSSNGSSRSPNETGESHSSGSASAEPEHSGSSETSSSSSAGPGERRNSVKREIKDEGLLQVNQTPFIQKLYAMLEDRKLDAVINWSPREDSFFINPGEEFSQILCLYFKHTNIASFVRQLSMYGFHKISQHSRESSRLRAGSQAEALFVSRYSWEFKHINGSFRRNDFISVGSIKRRSSRRQNKHGKLERHLVVTQSQPKQNGASPQEPLSNTSYQPLYPMQHHNSVPQLDSPQSGTAQLLQASRQSQQTPPTQTQQVSEAQDQQPAAQAPQVPQVAPAQHQQQQIQQQSPGIPLQLLPQGLPAPVNLAQYDQHPPIQHESVPGLSGQHSPPTGAAQQGMLSAWLSSRSPQYFVYPEMSKQVQQSQPRLQLPQPIQSVASEELVNRVLTQQRKLEGDIRNMQQYTSQLSQSAGELGLLVQLLTASNHGSHGNGPNYAVAHQVSQPPQHHHQLSQLPQPPQQPPQQPQQLSQQHPQQHQPQPQPQPQPQYQQHQPAPSALPPLFNSRGDESRQIGTQSPAGPFNGGASFGDGLGRPASAVHHTPQAQSAPAHAHMHSSTQSSTPHAQPGTQPDAQQPRNSQSPREDMSIDRNDEDGMIDDDMSSVDSRDKSEGSGGSAESISSESSDAHSPAVVEADGHAEATRIKLDAAREKGMFKPDGSRVQLRSLLN